jgi:CheY-like chemotaxis protein
VGIPADRLDSLWESFSQVDASTTRRYGGTGLGLTICKQLVELMGGEIGVDSELGQGSRFWARIPFAAAEVPQEPLSPLSGTVLLALPCPDLNLAAAETLRFLGLDPVICPASDDLASQVTLALAQMPACAAVITGPTSIDPSARGVARKLQAALGASAPPCVLTVCLGEVADAASMARDGFAAWVSVPLRTAKLHAALDSVLSVPSSAARQALVADQPLAAEPVERTGTLPLLLAEDNPVNQKVASILLRKLGYTVEVVDNGAEAVAALARRRYRLVLMDVQMPVMDGYEAVRRIRQGEDGVLEPTVLIVALTAHAMAGDRQRCLDAGMDDYLAKPIDAAALADLLEHLLDSREAAPA